jgi:uncharacterized protein (TIGR03435 family)
MTKLLAGSAYLVFPVLVALCQTAPAPLAFEVASIKPAPPPTGTGLSVRVSQDKGRITMTNVSLRDVLAQAYNIRLQQLTTPDWMENTRFDIVAKLPEGAAKEQIPAMLRSLLADRFNLKMHKESKVMPVYALITAKGGPKLHPAEGDHGLNVHGSPKGREMKGQVSMVSFAKSLSGTLDRPVVDMTGIQGAYEIDLSWAPDDTARSSKADAGDPKAGDPKAGDAPDAPTIFTVLQEKMGLKLEARKMPSEIVVVDYAEKIPTEN